MIKLSKSEIVAKVVADIPSGSVVNLGIGLPVLALEYWSAQDEVIVHSENGILGMRLLDAGEASAPNLTNAAKLPVGVHRGAAFFDHSDSFAMMRGGHLDYSVLGAYQVSSRGDLANWSLNNTEIAPAVGGAMDLVVGAKKVFVVMEHLTREGHPRLVKACDLPLTGSGCVSRVYTDLATMDICDSSFVVRDITDGISQDYLESVTAAPLDFSLLEAV